MLTCAFKRGAAVARLQTRALGLMIAPMHVARFRSSASPASEETYYSGVPVKAFSGRLLVGEGERVGVWKRNGQYECLQGPRVQWLFGAKVASLPRYCAQPGQYLQLVRADGTCQVLPGPSEVWDDPIELLSIQVKDGIQVGSNEAMVVYKEKAGSVERHIMRGPAMYLPEAENEWLHHFSWHGASPADPEIKVPSALQFSKLRMMPDQLYFTVRDVRTSDDALIHVKLMLFFQLQCVETMLDSTHDPIADFINGVSADIIDFASSRSFERFKSESDKLNSLVTYDQLCTRASGIGYKVSKVVFRGYSANPALQTMHDEAIEQRTKMKLEQETMERQQALRDFTLAKEMERAEMERQQQKDTSEHHIRMRQKEEQAAREEKRLEQEQQLEFERRRAVITNEAHRQRFEDEVEHYLKPLKVWMRIVTTNSS